MSVYETAARFIEEHGETMVLSRSGETGLAVKGKRIAGNTEDLGNGSVQAVFRVKIGTDELTSSAWSTKSPKRGDKLLVDGRARAVRDAFPLKDGDTVALYELEVAG
ncbi:MAG: hypothetical protein FD144_4770 [Rhodospirillaceae bacterium]|nr:MAG: hypothetical protein FD144_4770 [Rhodospirillaceae bacterium]